eukprot:CAMPEP_0172451354 /NCGR_PEP_ID=MMETSP1065-20121228/9433_1 /TAXON_ID=265537 /ORGANISM="Amphiprora paludosa, Strain CCMP125" /LENGTH=723 /DNA_ID=CAMNT_0013203305 /DNA_START=112 /DNA_END=2283 /DNA_ORIENTATION=-
MTRRSVRGSSRIQQQQEHQLLGAVGDQMESRAWAMKTRHRTLFLDQFDFNDNGNSNNGGNSNAANGGNSNAANGGSWQLAKTLIGPDGKPVQTQLVTNPSASGNKNNNMMQNNMMMMMKSQQNMVIHKVKFIYNTRAPTPPPASQPGGPSPPTPTQTSMPTPASSPTVPTTLLPTLNAGVGTPGTQAPSPSLPTTGNQQQNAPFFLSPTAPTPPPIDIGSGFNPPKKVVTASSAPTTPVPTPSPTPAPTPVRIVQRAVTSDTIEYETVGTVNLVTVEQDFFDATQWMLTPYLASSTVSGSQQLGSLLNTYKLTLTFRETTKVAESLSDSTAKNTAERLYTNVFEAQLRLDLEGPQEAVEALQPDDATRLVDNFFKGDSLVALIAELNRRDISIKMIRLYDPNSSPIPTTPSGDGTDREGSDQSGSGSNTSAIVIATIACGAIVLVVLFGVLLIKRRQRQQTYYYGQDPELRHDPLESPLSSVYSSGSDERGGGIKSAAIQKNRKNLHPAAAEEYHDEPSFSNHHMGHSSYNDYTNDGYPDLGMNNSRDGLLAAPIPHSSDGDPASDDMDGISNDNDEFYDEHYNEAYDDQQEGVFRVQNPLDYTEVAGATLTNLDGDGSLNGIDRSYPEFEMFVNVATPTSPQWPEEDPYAEHTDEYHSQRKRWQEEANDVDLIGLPDRHETSSRGSSRTRSTTQDPWDDNVQEDMQNLESSEDENGNLPVIS